MYCSQEFNSQYPVKIRLKSIVTSLAIKRVLVLQHTFPERVLGHTGKFEGPPVFKSTNVPGQYLSVKFEYSSVLWPWSGFLALFIRVLPEAAAVDDVASGEVSFTIISPPTPGSTAARRSSVTFPVTVRIIRTPSRLVFKMQCSTHLLIWAC